MNLNLNNMNKIEKFEDLICWQKARVLTKNIYSISSEKSFSRDFALRDQIRKASLSIMLNIAEGFARRSLKEFKRFLLYSKGSSAEVQAALYIASDLNYLNSDEFESLHQDCAEVSKIICGLINSLPCSND